MYDCTNYGQLTDGPTRGRQLANVWLYGHYPVNLPMDQLADTISPMYKIE